MTNVEQLGWVDGPDQAQAVVGLYSYREALVAEVESVADRASVAVRTGPGSTGVDLMLIDHECLAKEPGFGRDPGWDAGVRAVVLGLSGESEACAELCDRGGWGHCVELPLGAGWLGELMAEVSGADRVSAVAPPRASSPDPVGPELGRPNGLLIGVMGGVGGAGASTVSMAIAAGAVTDGSAVLLVDADPLGAGLAGPIGVDCRPDRGWEAISGDAQTLDPQALAAALPRPAGFSLLTGPSVAGQEVPTALPAVVDAGRAGFDVTVVDLPRTPGGVAFGRSCDVTVVVATTSLVGVLGSRRLLAALLGVAPQFPGQPAGRIHLVARCGGPVPLPAVERYLDQPVAVAVPNSRLIAERADAGELLHGRSGRKLAGWGRQVLGALR